MKVLNIYIFLIIVLILSCGTEQKNEPKIDEKEIVAKFEALVKKYSLFFEKTPGIIQKQNYPDSPTREIYLINKYKLSNLSYDIQKSDSLISPYIGYIEVHYFKYVGTKCGDFYVKIMDEHFNSTLEKARQHLTDEQCFKFFEYHMNPEPYIRFFFTYNNGKWTFNKFLEFPGGNYSPEILDTINNAPYQGHPPIIDNNNWRSLIESN